MSQHQSSRRRQLSTGLTPDKPRVARQSTQRAEQIKQYIHGLLPSDMHATVDVVITDHVTTAAVAPATADALMDSEQTDVNQKQADHLLNQVDGDYLVLITGRETSTDSIYLNDQLTVDSAFQFGLALHETLHILKTAFGGIKNIVETEVDPQHQGFVHNLINITEDGAIENEATTGEDFSDRASARLKLINEVLTHPIDDYETLPESARTFTLGDAVMKSLFERLIYNRDITDILLDETNELITFSSDDERRAYLEVHGEIESLATDILSTRGDETDQLFKNDKEASIKRAKRTVQFWHDVLKPLQEQNSPEQEWGSPQEQPNGDQQQDQNQQQADQPQSDQSGQEGQPSPENLGQDGEQSGEQGGEPGDGNEESGNEVGEGVKESSDETSSESSSEQSTSGEIDPNNISFDVSNSSNDRQNISEYPSIGEEPNPDDIEIEPQQSPPTPDDSHTPDETDSQTDWDDQDSVDGDSQGDDNPTDTDDSETSDSDSQGDVSNENGDQSDAQPPDSQVDGGDDTDTGDGEDSAQGETEDGQGQGQGQEQDQPQSVEVESSSASSSLESQTSPSQPSTNGQSTFGDFAQDTEQNDSEQADTNGEADESGQDEIGDAEDTSESVDSEAGDQTIDNEDSSKDADSESSSDDVSSEGGSEDVDSEIDNKTTSSEDGTQDSSSESLEETETDNDKVESDSESNDNNTVGDNTESTSDEPAGDVEEPDERTSGPAHDDEDLSADDLESDRRQAERTAQESTIDEQALEAELQELQRTLEREQKNQLDNQPGVNGAGPGSVDELTILPQGRKTEQLNINWDSVEKAAAPVGDTLAKMLRLDQRSRNRRGLSSGTTVDRKLAHRLCQKDPRVFNHRVRGRQKEYFIVLVLDRSSSMVPWDLDDNEKSKMEIASQAVARFSVACESLGIDVAIIDFYDDEARLIKPQTVETQFAKDSILNTETAGCTPLADSLSLARSLADQDSKESIIITMTDGKPDEVDDVIDEIKASHSPICSLTIATDCENGNPPEKAEQLETEYDQTTTVYDPGMLDRRLDEFATTLGAY